MKILADRHKLELRPHFKTHQSQEIGEWFRETGIEKIAVSSVSMAEYFLQSGWKDIFIAFPVNVLEIEKIKKLSGESSLTLLVSDFEVIDILEKEIRNTIQIFVKIDTGYNRAGISSENIDEIVLLVKKIESLKYLNFKGIATHNGRTYTAKGEDEVLEIQKDELSKLSRIKSKLRSMNSRDFVSVGDTPACSLSGNFEGINEIRPGNFVFYDYMQFKIGSCKIDDIAVRMHCPVVSVQRSRKKVIIYGGAIHFSKEYVFENKLKIFGKVDEISGKNSVNANLVSLSQEHGIIEFAGEMPEIIVGDVLVIIPIHSCLTANLMDYYQTTGGQFIRNINFDFLHNAIKNK